MTVIRSASPRALSIQTFEKKIMQYQNFSKTELDQAYNNTLAVKDSSNILADWNIRGAVTAGRSTAQLDLVYGQNPRNRIDYFPSEGSNALLVFIHGGYWQMRSKETFRFLAEGPLARGLNVALVGYTLAPEASMEEIVSEVYAAIDWLCAHTEKSGDKDPLNIVISGWSAGGHLTAMCHQLAANNERITGLLPISGIFDLEPIRHCYLNDNLCLDEDSAFKYSPLHHIPESDIPTIVAFGTAELPELQRQSVGYAKELEEKDRKVQLLPVQGCNHFTILETLADPEGKLSTAAMALASPVIINSLN